MKKSQLFLPILILTTLWIGLNEKVVAANLSEPNWLTLLHITKDISGTVTDSDNNPLIGVNILVKGTDLGTATDFDGTFHLSGIEEDAILIVSYVGYKTKEIAVTDLTSIQIILESDSEMLDEVVVVGYGTQKKGYLTGSVASIKSKDLVQTPTGTVSNALYGRIPGLILKQSGGQPGMDAPSLSIRGFGSPLVIVDGVEGNMNTIDPYEIESITVLKDAAAAIYGARAGKGVVLVTTKRGVEGKPTFNLSSTYSFQGVTSFGKPVNAGQYAELIREQHLNKGLPESNSRFTEEDIRKYYEGNDPGYPNADWWDAIMNKWSPMQQHNLSITGGSDKIKYFGSFGFVDQKLMYKAGGNQFQRFNLRSNIDAKITENLSIKFDFSNIIEDRKYPNRDDFLIWQDLFNAEPVRYSSFPDATKVPITGEQLMNPIVDTHRDIGGYRDYNDNNIRSDFRIKYDLPGVEGLSLNGMVNYHQYYSFQKNFQKQTLLWDWDYQSDTYRVEANTPETRLNQEVLRSRSITSQISIDFDRNLNEDHHIKALLLYELIDARSTNQAAQRRGFLTNSIDYLFAGGEDIQYANGGAEEMGRTGYIGRLNYIYQNKYLLESTIRLDASAKFAPKKRWGLFPSISAGWVISEERFLKENQNKLDYLKLRGGMSQTGVDNFLNFQFLSGYTYGVTHLFGSGLERGLVSTGMANPDLSWEEITIYNAGLEFGLKDRVVYGEFDVFYRTREGIPAYRYATLPSTFGEVLPQENINSQNNRGFEVMLGHAGQAGDFEWDISGNVSWSRAKWNHFEEAPYTDPDEIRVQKQSGQWTNRIFGLLSDGLFTTQEEIDALTFEYPNGNSVLRPGDVKYIDRNNDGILDWKDNVELATGGTPNWMLGLSLNFRYKNFDLSTLFQGAMGSYVQLDLGLGASVPKEYVFHERWTPENNDKYALVPRRGGSETNYLASDFNLKSSDYVRLKTLNFGYSLPAEHLFGGKIRDLRFYFAGMNLFTWDKLSQYNLDPESSFSGDGLYYPQQRTLTFGMNLSF